MSNRLVHASLILVPVLWGLVFIGIHKLLPVMSAVELVTLRFGIITIAFVVLFIAMPQLRVMPRGRADWIRFLVCAVLTVPGAQLSQVYAQRFISPQLASLIVATSPVMTAILAAILIGESFTRVRAVGSVIALLGVAFIVIYGAGSGGGIGHATFTWPAAIAVISPLSWSLYTVISRPLSARYPPISTVGLCIVLGTALLVPFVPQTVGVLPALTLGDWGWVAFLAVGGSLVPYLIWFWSLQRLPANRVAVYMYPIPLFAMLFSWLILHRTPGEVAWIGAGCVLAGVLLTQVTIKRRVPVGPDAGVAAPLCIVEMEQA